MLVNSVDAFTFVIHQLAVHIDIKNPVYRKKFQYQCFEILRSIDDYGILLIYLEQL